MLEAAMFFVKFDIWEKGKFPACVQVYGSFCNRWSLILLGDCLDIHNRSDYEEKDVGFNICKKLKMFLYSQINPLMPP